MKKNKFQKSSLKQMFSNIDSIWTFASKIWILTVVFTVFFAFMQMSKKNQYANINQKLTDSVALLDKKLNHCQTELNNSYYFIEQTQLDINNLSVTISEMKKYLESYEKDKKITNLLDQVNELQKQANVLNNQISKMKQDLNASPKKGKSK